MKTVLTQKFITKYFKLLKFAELASYIAIQYLLLLAKLSHHQSFTLTSYLDIIVTAIGWHAQNNI